MDYNHPIITQNAQETSALGEKFAQYIESGAVPPVFCLYGNLGSGKTTFTQGIARGLGITSRLLSPTFIIVRRYDLVKHYKALYHIDLYRLNSVDDMEELGLSEIFIDPAAYVVIEWAEKLPELPQKRLDIWFKALNDARHEITVKSIR